MQKTSRGDGKNGGRGIFEPSGYRSKCLGLNSAAGIECRYLPVPARIGTGGQAGKHVLDMPVAEDIEPVRAKKYIRPPWRTPTV